MHGQPIKLRLTFKHACFSALCVGSQCARSNKFFGTDLSLKGGSIEPLEPPLNPLLRGLQDFVSMT